MPHPPLDAHPSAIAFSIVPIVAAVKSISVPRAEEWSRHASNLARVLAGSYEPDAPVARAAARDARLAEAFVAFRRVLAEVEAEKEAER